MLTQIIPNKPPLLNQALIEEIPINRTTNTNPLFSQNPKLNQNQLEVGIFEGIQLQDKELTNQLRSLSYFELLDQTPSIKQLFSRDYMDLVSNLVSIQENKEINKGIIVQDDSLNPLNDNNLELVKELNMIKNLNQDTSFLENHTNKSLNIDISNITNSNSHNPVDQNSNYNHLLFQNNINHTNNSPIKESPNNHKPKYLRQETSAKPYEDKRKDKNNNTLTKNLIKSAIRGLNKLSLKLNQFVQ